MTKKIVILAAVALVLAVGALATYGYVRSDNDVIACCSTRAAHSCAVEAVDGTCH